jgi:sialate O-acetylesterase
VVIRVQESPKYLYYGWQAWSRGNLVNAAQLPTSTFRMPVTSNQ